MSKKWIYQIKNGVFWGVFMSVFNLLFELQEKSLRIQLSSSKFYVRMMVFVFVGIFIIGYFNWKDFLKRKNIAER